jgi:Protein of unknown function (DUF3102)
MTNTALTPQAPTPPALKDLTQTELVKGVKEALSSMVISFQNSVKHAIRAGELLIEAKSRLQHGEFGSWLEENFKLSRATATRYMKLAENRKEIEVKLLTVSNLNLADAYKLLGVTNSNSNNGAQSSTMTSEPETEEEKEKQKLSDKVDGLVDKLVGTLKELKTLNADEAIAATVDLLNQLKAADLIEERKGRKAA